MFKEVRVCKWNVALLFKILDNNIDGIVAIATLMEYVIIRGNTPKKLGRKVRERIDKGWKPIGGVSAVYPSESNLALSFYQAVIKQ